MPAFDTFGRNFQHSVEHVAIAKQADVMMTRPQQPM